MDATVNIKMTPAEFDLLREALASFREQNMALVTKGSGADMATQSQARKKTVLTDDLLSKLR
jgi:hypothetical protein